MSSNAPVFCWRSRIAEPEYCGHVILRTSVGRCAVNCRSRKAVVMCGFLGAGDLDPTRDFIIVQIRSRGRLRFLGAAPRSRQSPQRRDIGPSFEEVLEDRSRLRR